MIVSEKVNVQFYLQKLKVVLEFPLHKSVHWNYFVNRHLLERSLQNFEVVDVLMLLLRVELHLQESGEQRKQTLLLNTGPRLVDCKCEVRMATFLICMLPGKSMSMNWQ